MLGIIIRKLRLEQGLKQEDLGRRLGVTKQSVSNWENGNIMPSIDLLEKLSDHFGVTTDYMLGRESRQTLDITGLSDEQATHIQMIINDLRK